MEPLIGTIVQFAGNFAPKGWLFCEGQLLSISQNAALFSILGTIYGGDGQTTFALPDLRGRVCIQPGQGPGLPNYTLGQTGGGGNASPGSGPNVDPILPFLAINWMIAIEGVYPSRP
jgi:microcystin-dependent protein